MTRRRRVAYVTAARDIRDAFEAWDLWSGGMGDVAEQDEYEAMVAKARARVESFLADVRRERVLLRDALAACREAHLILGDMVRDGDYVPEQHAALDMLAAVLDRADTP